MAEQVDPQDPGYSPPLGDAASREAVHADLIESAPAFDRLQAALGLSYATSMLPDWDAAPSLRPHGETPAAPEPEMPPAPEPEAASAEATSEASGPLAAAARGIEDAQAALADGRLKGRRWRQLRRGVEGAGEMFAAGEHTTEEIAATLGVIADMRPDALRKGLWGVVKAIPDEQLAQLFIDKNPALHTLLGHGLESSEVAADRTQFAGYIDVLHKAASPQFDTVLEWKKNGRPNPDLPEYMYATVADPRFTPAVIDLTVERARSVEDITQRDGALRAIERKVLRDMIGMPEDFVEDFQIAFESRSQVSDQFQDSGVVGSVDTGYWRNQLAACTRAIEAVGVDEAAKVWQKFGIVNFDRYDASDMRLLAAIVRPDPVLMAKLQRPEEQITFVVSDTFDPARGSAKSAAAMVKRAARGHSVVIPTEVRPDKGAENGALRARIEELVGLGLKPSTVVFDLHGNDEFMVISGEENDHELVDHAELTELGQFLSGNMKPRSDTGERLVLMLSCRQGKKLVKPSGLMSRLRSLTGRPNGRADDKISGAEALIADVPAESAMVVHASPDSVGIHNEPNGNIWYSRDYNRTYTNKDRALVAETRKDSSGNVTHRSLRRTKLS